MVRVKAVFVAVALLALVVVAGPVLVLAPRDRRRRTRDSGATLVGSHFWHREPTGTVGPVGAEDEGVRLAIQLVTRCDPFMPRADARPTRVRVAALLAAVAERPGDSGGRWRRADSIRTTATVTGPSRASRANGSGFWSSCTDTG
jgi:hypothetical protein